MKLNKKLIIITIAAILVLVIIPLIFINLAQPHEFMGIMILLFFIINPILVIFVNLIIGKYMKKLWWIPLMFSIIFLISYWIILEEIIFDLIVYAIMYLIIGLIVMFISFFISKKRK